MRVSTLKLFTLETSQRVKFSPARILRGMTWLFWAILSAVFAAATALLAKVGVAGIDSNLATAIRTSVILVFTWAIAIGFEKHHALVTDRTSQLGISCSVRSLYRIVVAVLLPGAAVGPCFQRRPCRQAERGACDSGSVAIFGRAVDPPEDWRGVADHDRRCGACLCVRRRMVRKSYNGR